MIPMRKKEGKILSTKNKAVRSQEVPAMPLTPVLRGHTQEMGEEDEDSN